MESFYQYGDKPGNWDTCPLGRYCKANNLEPSPENAAILLNRTKDWVEGYINGFDGFDHISKRTNYFIGYETGEADRKLMNSLKRDRPL